MEKTKISWQIVGSLYNSARWKLESVVHRIILSYVMAVVHSADHPLSLTRLLRSPLSVASCPQQAPGLQSRNLWSPQWSRAAVLAICIAFISLLSSLHFTSPTNRSLLTVNFYTTCGWSKISFSSFVWKTRSSLILPPFASIIFPYWSNIFFRTLSV